MMINRKNIAFILQGFLFILLLLSSKIVIGQHNHINDMGFDSFIAVAPNGGEIKKSGKYRIEMLANLILKEDKLSFYVYKRNMKLLSNEEINGTIEIKFDDGTIVNEILEKRDNGQFVVQLANASSFQCVVSFIIKGKKLTVEFNYSALEKERVSIYSCPMHPEIQNDLPGKCPICSMNLIEK